MYFKIGYTVRPKNVNISNQVIFEEYDVEDVLQDVLPTENECIAYGFVFRESDSKCVVVETPLRFNYPKPTDNLSINRASNFIGRNTRDNIIAGSSHIIYSNNYGNIISGENNSITDLVSNTTISGTKGEATADNSNVIGANSVLAGTSPLGNELVQNGDFDEIGAEEVLNGDFSELGAEKVTNGFFERDTDWIGVGSNGWSIDTVLQQLDAVSASSYVYQGIGTVSGKNYKVVVDATLISGGCIVRGFSANNIININISGRNTYTADFIESDGNANIGFLTSGEEFTGSIHSISVKEVGIYWTTATGWTIANDKATSAGSNFGGQLKQTILETNKIYLLTFDIVDYTSGKLSLQSSYYGETQLFSGIGSYTAYFTSLSQTELRLYSQNLIGSIDNVSVKEVLEGWNAYYSGTLNNIGGALNVVDGGGGARAVTEITTVIGKTYKYIADFIQIQSINTLISVSNANNLDGAYVNGANITIPTNGVSVTFTATATTTYIGFKRNGAGVGQTNIYDNVSVKEQLPYIAPKQSIQLLYGLQSTDGSNQSSFLNGITDSLFAIPENSVMYFHADIVAVRVGGTDTSGGGLPGDYGSWVERGVIINKSGVLSISRERDTIKSSGHTTNWQPTAIVDGLNFGMRVRGHTDMVIEWASNITFTEIKTGVAL